MRFFLGVACGIVLVAVAVFAYLRFGNLPVATADSPFPMERAITHMALDARIHKQMVKTPPVAASPAALQAGVQIYLQQCASCHGVVGKDSAFAKTMFPHAPQLFVKHRNGDVVGVSDDEPGETYWKVANGIRLTGMPAYKTILSENEMWSVSQLLANADKLTPDLLATLKQDNLKQPIPQQ